MEEKSLNDDNASQGTSTPITDSCRNRELYDEFAELTAELQPTHVTKQLQAQTEENQAKKCARNMRTLSVDEMVELQQRMALEEGRWRRTLFQRRSEEHRRQLNEQLRHKEQERKIIAEEICRYRKSLEEIDRLKEKQECSKILEKKSKLAESEKREKLILKEIKEIRWQEQRKADEKKRLQDLEYVRESEYRLIEINSLQMAHILRRHYVVDQMTTTMLDHTARSQERRQQLQSLIIDEIRYELMIHEKMEILRKIQIKQELESALEEQVVFTEKCRREFGKRDIEWGREIMKRIIKDKKMAKYKADERKTVKLFYQNELHIALEVRRQIREYEIARMENDVKEEKRKKQAKSEFIKQQRMQLLTELAANVAKYANRAAITDEENGIHNESTKDVSKVPKNIDDDKEIKD